MSISFRKIPHRRLKLGVCSVALLSFATSAFAGGFDRSAQDFDILFDEGHRLEAGVTWVNPSREYKNIRGSYLAGVTQGINPTTGLPYATSAKESEDYFVPKFSARLAINDDAACAAQFREPFGAKTNVGMNSAAIYDSIVQEIDTRDYGLNCSYRFALSKGYFRLLGGVSYQEIKGYQSKYLLAGTPSFAPMPEGRVGFLNVRDTGVSWRAGVAYEIPEIALRTSLVYQSDINYNLHGRLGNVAAFDIPINGSATVPQSVELKMQSGIAPGWLAFGSAKWTNWSVVQSIGFYNSDTLGPVPPGGLKTTSLDLYYRDGWTLTGGVGHQITETLSAAGSVTWDRGTTQGLNSQTDTWLFSLGGAYTPVPNFEIKAGGALGWQTKGTKDNTFVNHVPNPTGFAADFGNDLVTAVSLTAKLKF